MDQDSKAPAGAPAWGRDKAGSGDSEPYHIWKPRPLLRSILWKPSTDSDSTGQSSPTYETFIVQKALDALFSHVWSSPHETSAFGFLVGDLCECPDSGGRYVIVNTAIPSRFPFKEEGEPQISTEANIALQLEVDRHKGVMVGWYHSHPKGQPRLSEQDLATHRSIFKEAWHTAILVTTDSARPEGAVFHQTEEGMDFQLLPFYEQVSNESLMAKGRKRTRIDWQNFVTDAAVVSDIAPRPDVPNVKAEEEAARQAAALEAEQAAEAERAAGAARAAEEEAVRVVAEEAQSAEEEAARKAAALEAEQAEEAERAAAAARAAEEEAARVAAEKAQRAEEEAAESERVAEAAEEVEAEAARALEEEAARVAAEEAAKIEEEAARKAAALEAERAAEVARVAEAKAAEEAARTLEEEAARQAAEEEAARVAAAEAAKAKEEAARKAAALEAERAAEVERAAVAAKAAEEDRAAKVAEKAAAKAEKSEKAARAAEEKQAARAAKKSEKAAKAAARTDEKAARTAAVEAEREAKAAEAEADRAARALEEEQAKAAALEADRADVVSELEATELETTEPPPPPRRKVAGGYRSNAVPQPAHPARPRAPDRAVKIAAEVATDEVKRTPAAVPSGRGRGVMLGGAGLLIVIAVLGALVTVVRSEASDGLTSGAADPVEDVAPVDNGQVDLAAASEGSPVEPVGDGSGGEPDETANSVASPDEQISRAGFEALSDNMLGVISAFYGHALRHDQGTATCAQLQAAFVSVEEGWMSYNVEGKSRFPERLTGDLLERDDRLYAGVQDVEREFDRSGCDRP